MIIGAPRSNSKNLPPESIRRDPVALYHYYKAFWDKQKAPGENPHMQLRWNVRAGTLGRVPCEPVSFSKSILFARDLPVSVIPIIVLCLYFS